MGLILFLVGMFIVVAFSSAPPLPPDFPMEFNISFVSTVFELDQIGNGILFYRFQSNPTKENPSWQTVRNQFCPTGDVKSACDYIFIDTGDVQQFWVDSPKNKFCCLVLPVGPVIPTVLRSWSFFGTFPVEGVMSNNFYSLEGGVNNLNTFSVSAKNNAPIAMTRAGPGAFNSTLLWKFTSSFVTGPQDPALASLPTYCKPQCGAV